MGCAARKELEALEARAQAPSATVELRRRRRVGVGGGEVKARQCASWTREEIATMQATSQPVAIWTCWIGVEWLGQGWVAAMRLPP